MEHSARMARITDCSDELLLDIALHLGLPDNMALALTAQKLRGAAQELLYTQVKLPYPPQSLPLILRTPVQRPDRGQLYSVIPTIEMT